MFRIFIGCLFVFIVSSHSVIYRREVHSTKRLTRQHTFLDQLCLPDEYLDIPIEYIMVKVFSVLNPSKLRVIRKYIDTATGLRVTYREHMKVEMYTWAQVNGNNNGTRHQLVLNNTLTQIQTDTKSAECVDIRYYTPFIGDEQFDRVQIQYKIEVYWIVQSFNATLI